MGVFQGRYALGDHFGFVIAVFSFYPFTRQVLVNFCHFILFNIFSSFRNHPSRFKIISRSIQI